MESRNSIPNNDSSEIQSFPCPIRTIDTGIKPDGLVEQMVLAENKAQDLNDALGSTAYKQYLVLKKQFEPSSNITEKVEIEHNASYLDYKQYLVLKKQFEPSSNNTEKVEIEHNASKTIESSK